MKGAIFLITAVLLTVAGCSLDEKSSLPEATVSDWLPLVVGSDNLSVQVALTPSEQRKGLMYRDHLPEDHGMLFVYTSPQRASYWMSNTRIPLDIAFVDSSGKLLEIHRMVPYDTTRTVSKSGEVQFALEVNSGWFARKGIFPGTRLDMESVSQALKRRGENPEEYGL